MEYLTEIMTRMQKKAFIPEYLNTILKRYKPWNLMMLTAAAAWLSYEFWRLTWDSSRYGAIDLVQRYKDIFFWFRGFQIYGVISTASYPPASYAMLWPAAGVDEPACRALALGSAFYRRHDLALLCFQKGKQGGNHPGADFHNPDPLGDVCYRGCHRQWQLIVLILPALITSLLLMQRTDYSWKTELAACFLFLIALVKPSMTAPFFWIVLFIPGRLRTALMIIAGYAGISFFSASFQGKSLFALLPEWLSSSSQIMAGHAKYFSQSNIHSWFAAQGIEQWAPPVSIVILVLLGIWVSLNRKADPWLIISAVAIISRIWTYHAWYDDLLIAPAMIALFRIAKSNGLSSNLQSALRISLFIIILFMTAPGGLYLLPSPLKELYVAGQVFIWLSLLIFLIYFIHRDKKRKQSPPANQS